MLKLKVLKSLSLQRISSNLQHALKCDVRNDSAKRVKIKPLSQSSRNLALKFTSANVNRRNGKGETPLHRACIQNQPGRVTQLLAVPGVDPNSRDNVGWTPLSEACNRGYVECVKELLRLPLQSGSEVSESFPLIIDLLACPEEGKTPLHDALDNGHIDVSRMLLEKGGIELLYVTDKEGKTPLDACASEELRGRVLEIALEIGSKVSSQQPAMDDVQFSAKTELPSYFLPEIASYEQILFASNELKFGTWLNSCRVYSLLVQHLVNSYVAEKKLLVVLARLVKKYKRHSSLKSVLSSYPSYKNDEELTEITRIEQDLAYLMHWEAIEEKFKQHLTTLCENLPFISTYSCLSKGVRSLMLNLVQG